MSFCNLDAEMCRYGITIQDIATDLGINERTLRNKVNGVSEFTYRECKRIRNKWFPGMSLEYLFADTPVSPVNR